MIPGRVISFSPLYSLRYHILAETSEMRIAVIGRTSPLIEAARKIIDRGHTIGLVWTCGEQSYYGAGPNEFRGLADKHGAKFTVSPKINAAFSGTEGCDLAISLGWPTRIGKTVIEAFPKGILNGHAGDLPAYRGTAAPNWAVLNGEPYIGLCIHFMAVDYDDGPVIRRDRFALLPDTYIGAFYDWSNKVMPQMFAEAVDYIAKGVRPENHVSRKPLYCYPRQREDSRIRWSDPVEQIYRVVRASSRPFGGAPTSFYTRDITIWRAAPVLHPGQWCAMPGTVCYAIDGDPVIACADGMLRLQEIEAAFEPDQQELKRMLTSSKRNRLE